MPNARQGRLQKVRGMSLEGKALQTEMTLMEKGLLELTPRRFL